MCTCDIGTGDSGELARVERTMGRRCWDGRRECVFSFFFGATIPYLSSYLVLSIDDARGKGIHLLASTKCVVGLNFFRRFA